MGSLGERTTGLHFRVWLFGVSLGLGFSAGLLRKAELPRGKLATV